MTPERFNTLVEKFFATCTTTLTQKAAEYADEDRLANFKKAARVAGCTPEQALMGFRLKHDVALADYVQWQSEGKQVPIAWFTEKIGDILAYNVLLLALISERYEEDETCQEKP
jgi:hypothetical protein